MDRLSLGVADPRRLLLWVGWGVTIRMCLLKDPAGYHFQTMSGYRKHSQATARIPIPVTPP